MKKVFIIDGDKFSNFKGFCKEFSDIVLSGKYKWNGNLDTFNDILFGGFGDIEYEEQFTIIWKNSAKSKVDLGYSETIVKLNEILNNCHQSNEEEVIQEINDAKLKKGPTIFDWIEEIIVGRWCFDLGNHLCLYYASVDCTTTTSDNPSIL